MGEIRDITKFYELFEQRSYILHKEKQSPVNEQTINDIAKCDLQPLRFIIYTTDPIIFKYEIDLFMKFNDLTSSRSIIDINCFRNNNYFIYKYKLYKYLNTNDQWEFIWSSKYAVLFIFPFRNRLFISSSSSSSSSSFSSLCCSYLSLLLLFCLDSENKSQI